MKYLLGWLKNAAGSVSHFRRAVESPDGGYLATLNHNGTVYVLSLDGIASGK